MELHELELQGLREYLAHPRNRGQILDRKSQHNGSETHRGPDPLTPFLLPNPVERLLFLLKQEYKNPRPPESSLFYLDHSKDPRSLLAHNGLYSPSRLEVHSVWLYRLRFRTNQSLASSRRARYFA